MLYYNLYFTGSILNVLFWGLDTIAIRIPVVLYIFEGQIINVRSSTGQEISSGGNIILYPENPTVSFKEAMKITPYRFKCMDGKWIKIN